MTPPDKDLIPTTFKAQIGGYFGPSYCVAMKDESTLLYKAMPDGYRSEDQIEEERVPVTIPQWARFREALDGADIWNWESNYDNPGVMDGTSWGIEITYGDASVDSGGSNANPPEFPIFLKAVWDLLGGREFR